MQRESYIGNRFEFKYVLDPFKAQAIEAYLTSLDFDKDEHGEGGYYTVNSIYLDTPLRDDYRNKEAVLMRRKKLRLRIYEPFFSGYRGSVWLEIKRKHDMRVWKERAEISADIARSILSGDVLPLYHGSNGDEKEREVMHTFAYYALRHRYRPSVGVRYRRRPFLSKFLTPIRITLDRDIEAYRVGGRIEDGAARPVSPRMTVMEVKFNYTLPWWFTDMVRRFNISRIDFSKYNRATDALDLSYGKVMAR